MNSVLNYTLPDDWNDCELNNLIATDSNITYGVVQPGPQDPDGVPFVRGGDIYNGKIAIDSLRTISTEVSNGYRRTLLKGGELLMSLVGYPGEVAVVPRELAGANIARQAACIKLGRMVDTKYVMYYLQSDIGKYFLFQKSTGSAQQVINLIDLKMVTVLFPPLPEQQEITSILSSVDDVIYKTTAQIDKLKDLKTGMMQELLTKGIGHTEFKDSPVGRIPVGWNVQTLQEVASIQTGAAKNSKAVGDLVDIPYLRVANVQDGYLDLSEIKTISIERARVDRFLLQDEDVLVNEGGDFDKLGRGSIWRNQISPCVHQNHVFVVRTNHDVLLPMFFNYLSGSQHGKKYFLGCAKQTTNLASINSSQLKMFPVLLPSLGEQESICNIFGSIDRKIDVIQLKLAKIQDQKKALMQDLLTGKVRISVN